MKGLETKSSAYHDLIAPSQVRLSANSGFYRQSENDV